MTKKVTKRPKRVTVKYEEVIAIISKYTCPSCYVSFVGGGPDKNVTRFVCTCGQELIVDKRTIKPLDTDSR